MIENLPILISVAFELTTLLTLVLFYFVLKNSKTDHTKANVITIGLIFWIILQSALTLNNVYNTNTTTLPPRFIFVPIPPLLFIIFLFNTKRGKRFIDSLPLLNITYLNIVRIPVEIVLYYLFLNKAVPELMTFSGRNFDILSGITAPVIAYYGLQQHTLNKKIVLIWNILALGLLVNIVLNAVLSAPFTIQQFAFDQPNIAVLNFPFSLLPAFIVPIVLFGHLVSIRQLTTSSE